MENSEKKTNIPWGSFLEITGTYPEKSLKVQPKEDDFELKEVEFKKNIQCGKPYATEAELLEDLGLNHLENVKIQYKRPEN